MITQAKIVIVGDCIVFTFTSRIRRQCGSPLSIGRV